ncbi:MAG: nucleotide exchange factor GrpE [Nitrospirae bacterium]|nr:nucleotide exchange factor GrpE [Nitrospirota bacterium]
MTEEQNENTTENIQTKVNESQENNAAELKKNLDELTNKYLRLYAEFENYKKFSERTKQESLKYANDSIMKDLLPVIDHLELALTHSSNNENSKSLSEGIILTLKELNHVFSKYGLVAIKTEGEFFDPSFHHAISQIESEELENNLIVKEFRKGYMLYDRVLRASLVEVSKKPAINK